MNYINVPYAKSIKNTSSFGIKGCGYGILVIIFIVIIIIISTYCFSVNYSYLHQKINETFKINYKQLKNKLKKKVKEKFEHVIKQPQIFTKGLLSVPGNCQPFIGCNYPSYLSNPISLKTGQRPNAKDEHKIWCEKSWRDCNAYQNCVNGKCKPKNNVYPKP